MQQFFDYSPEVLRALTNKQPILALESTVITHGLPYPNNIETAQILEQTARDHDVTPATIAIMNGKIKIGLTAEELKILVQDSHSIKASRRDIAYAISQQLNAGTTVAATLYCAYQAGLQVFATGGIGGVHRGDDEDISADLIELARIPMAIVCAGAKAILDLPRTLEFLETFSVPMVGYQTNKLPAFYTAHTIHDLPARVDNVDQLADMFTTHKQLGLTSSMIIMNPIPYEYEIPTQMIDPVIAQALVEANNQNIKGKAITPFLLAKLAELTAGKSKIANIHLLKNNVALGAQLAKKLMQQG